MDESDGSEISELRRRIVDLETDVARLLTLADPPAAAPRPLGSPPPLGFPPPLSSVKPVPPPPVHNRQVAQGSPKGFDLTSETALRWGGVGLVILGVIFALSSSIRRGWVGPELQLIGALAFAFSLIELGRRLHRHRTNWGNALLVGGVVSIFATFASNLFVDLTSEGIGLGLCSLAALFGFSVAWHFRSEWVGIASLAATSASGLFLGVLDRPQYVTALWGLGLASAGLCLATFIKGHRFRLVSQLYCLVWASIVVGAHVGGGLGLVDFVALLLVFAALTLLPSIGTRQSTARRVEVQLSIWLAPWLGLMSRVAIGDPSDSQKGLAYAAGATLVAIVVAAARRILERSHLVTLALGAGIGAMIALAVVLPTNTFFFTLAVQGAAIMYIYCRVETSTRVLLNSLVLLSVSSSYLFVTSWLGWLEPASLESKLTNAGILLSLALVGWIVRTGQLRELMALVCLPLVMVYVGSILALQPQGQAMVSMVWALIGTLVLLVGSRLDNRLIAQTGLAVLAVTVAKLLSVDLDQVDALWRAGLFVAIGLGLVKIGLSLPGLIGADDVQTQSDVQTLSDAQTQESHS